VVSNQRPGDRRTTVQQFSSSKALKQGQTMFLCKLEGRKEQCSSWVTGRQSSSCSQQSQSLLYTGLQGPQKAPACRQRAICITLQAKHPHRNTQNGV
jgi:hypothetical protein